MDAKQFLKEFGHIANAPSGVQHLRELVLQLAISGKLVNQIIDEGTSGLSVKEAALNKKIYEEQLKLRKAKLISPLQKHEIPYVIPNHWKWERLDNIACYIQRGKGPKYNDLSKKLVVSQKCIKWAGFDLLLARGVDEESLEKYGKERFLKYGDLLWNSTGTGTAGRVCVYSLDENSVAVADSHVTVIRLTNFEPKYIWCLIAAPTVQSRFKPEHENSLVTGTTNQVELSTNAVKSLAVPCPPVEEQKRIVAKVNELMKLCDKLEAQQQKRNKLKNLTRTTILDALGNAQSPSELKIAWLRMKENMPLLFDRSEDVDVLRRVILNLAATGNLSFPMKSDSSALGLITMVKLEKSRLLAAGEIKRKKIKATEIKKVKIYTPTHWEKITIDDFFNFIDYRGRTPIKTACGRRLVTAKNVRPGRLNNEPAEFISEADYLPWMTRGFPKKGDLLITTEAPLGNVAQIDKEPDFALAQRVINLHPYVDIDTTFLLFFMMSPLFQSLLWENGTGTTAKGIKAAKLKLLEVSIPPIEEQERIVASVKKLFNFCGDLEQQLDYATSTSQKLSQSAIASLTQAGTENMEIA